MKKFALLMLVTLLSLLVFVSAANASTPTLPQLAKQVASLQKQVTTLKAQLKSAQSLLAIAPYVSLHPGEMNGVKGPNIVFRAANVHVMSEQDQNDQTGLGNLIVGWNDDPNPIPPNYRSGSNNLVVGSSQTFPADGCLLAGGWNTASQNDSFVCGKDNTVAGWCSSVTGGQSNTAAGAFGSVSGGQSNIAWGYASVSGGQSNTADANYSSITGGTGISGMPLWGWSAGGAFHNP